MGTLATLAGCSSDSSSGDASENDTTTARSSTESSADSKTSGTNATGSESDSGAGSKTATAKLGEVVKGGDISMVALSTSTEEKLGEYQEADSGNTFVVVRLAVKNTSDSFIDFNSFWQTRLKDSENHVYDASFGITSHPFDSGTLAPGEVSRGDVVYEVPKDATGLTMQFDFTAFDLFDFDRVTVELDQKAESISDLEQSLDVPVNSPGDSASKNDFSVTVHGVRTESELGDFAQADEGKEYVIPDIEITNDTGEPLTVSTLLQMRVKTGAGLSYTADLMGSSSLDQSYKEGSDIAPGESRRGELAYQVEKDAKPLYFVFDFLDLADAYKTFWKLR